MRQLLIDFIGCKDLISLHSPIFFIFYAYSQTVKVHRNCVLGASSGKVSWPLCFLDSPLTEWLQHLAWLWSGLNDLIYTKRSEEFLTHREHSMCHAPCVIFYFLSTDIIYNHGLVSQESFDDMALA